MNGLIAFTEYEAEALILCLGASFAWAGLLLVAVRSVDRARRSASAEKLWATALLLAVLPSLIAPTLAAFGLSLRPGTAAVAMDALAPPSPSPTRVAASASGEAPIPIDRTQIIGGAAIIYVYGVVLTFFLWAARQLGLYLAIARAAPVDDPALLASLDDWADRLDVTRPAVRRSRDVSSVCIAGVFRQTILVPEGIGARISREDLVIMGAHELAHLKRGDTRLFTATHLARVLFWFNPLVARIAAHTELAAEEKADALVLAKGVDRRRYAATFVEGLKFAAGRQNALAAFAPSFTPQGREGRRRRLNSILSPQPSARPPLATKLMLAAAVSTIALVAVGQAALAVDPDAARERRAALNAKAADLKEAPLANPVEPAKHTVRALENGLVVEAADGTLVIDRGHGRITRYHHLDAFSVKPGDAVRIGDAIATLDDPSQFRVVTLGNDEPDQPADPAAPAEPALPLDPPPPEPAPFADPDFAEPPEAPAAPEPPAAPGKWRRGFSWSFAPFASHAPLAGVEGRPLIAALEGDLLGGLDGGAGTVTVVIEQDGKVTRYTGDHPMTAEERAELRAIIGKAHRESREAEREADRIEAEAEREAALMEAEAEREAALEEARAEREAALAEAEAEREATLAEADARREAMRDMLEVEREAIAEAYAGLDENIDAAIDEALADLDSEHRDLASEGLSSANLARARASIDEARRQLLRDRETHKRAIEDARRDLDRRRLEIDRMLKAIDAEAARG